MHLIGPHSAFSIVLESTVADNKLPCGKRFDSKESSSKISGSTLPGVMTEWILTRKIILLYDFISAAYCSKGKYFGTN